jgi:hypothetical protein
MSGMLDMKAERPKESSSSTVARGFFFGAVLDNYLNKVEV